MVGIRLFFFCKFEYNKIRSLIYKYITEIGLLLPTLNSDDYLLMNNAPVH